MKILKLEFQNLNSLAGVWTIDFTDPNYVNNGIFCITGPTGAGKSTIMDAICLGLYGQTPRLGKITTSSNEIMTVGTGECYSKVWIETQKGKFISVWNQSRARKKPNAKLQNQLLQIFDENMTPQTRLNREAESMIEDITGMNFDRFTQSMMLAQGKFAEFLVAKPNDKAPILEQITGTDIYTQISRLVYERKALEERELDRIKDLLKSFDFLSVEEKESMNAEIEALTETLKVDDLSQKTYAEQINWLRTLETLTLRLNENQKKLQQNQEKRSAFKESEFRLERGEAALPITADYRLLKNRQDSIRELTAQKNENESKFPALKLAAEEKSQILHSLEIDATDKKTQLDDLQTLLITVRKTDVELKGIRKDMETIAGKSSLLNQNLQKVKRDKQALETELEGLNNTRIEAVNYLAERPGDAGIGKELPAVKLLFAALQDHHKNLSDSLKEIERCQKAATGKQEEIERMKADIAENEALLTGKNNEILAKTSALEGLKNGSKEEDLKEKQEILNENRRLIDKIISLEKHRKQLKDGQACPLCGSLDHPYAVGNVPAPDDLDLEINTLKKLLADIEKLKNVVAGLKEEKQNLLVLQQSLGGKLALLKNDLVSLQDQQAKVGKQSDANKELVDTASSNILDKIKPFGYETLSLDRKNEILRELGDRETKCTQAASLIKDSDTLINPKKELISATDAQIGILENQQLDLGKEISAKTEELKEVQAKRAELFGAKNPDEEEAKAKKAASDAQIAQESMKSDLQKAQRNLEKCETEINRCIKGIDDSNVLLKNEEKSFNDKLVSSQFVDMEDFERAILSETDLKALRSESSALKNEKTEVDTLIRNTEESLAEENARNLTDLSSEELQLSQTELQKKIENNREVLIEKRSKLKTDEENIAKMGKTQQELEKQDVIYKKWEKLNKYIGSANGDKFRNFAQGLTFEIMIGFANKQLRKLTDRYEMIRDNQEPLQLNVIDRYQGDTIRGVENLSGGESFMFSLSLALGLAHMSSKNVKIETLFLDEGFGTLDEDTLDTALNALSSLHEEGKLIGIISHVSALKENISTQIKIDKGPGGRSKLEGPGCSYKMFGK